MNNMNLSDTEIEILLFGKWRFNTNWEKISIEFKDDMTYEQTRIQTFLLSKPSELITGNKFTIDCTCSPKTAKFATGILSKPQTFENQPKNKGFSHRESRVLTEKIGD
jgi:hypothetical protein